MRAFGLWCAAAALALVSSAASAHLLNMTKVEVRIEADGQVAIQLQVDLNRAVGSSLEYYRLSQVAQPRQAVELAPLLSRLEDAVSIQAVGKRIPLHLVSVELPKLSQQEFLNPLSWPMTQVKLAGVLPVEAKSSRLQGVLRPTFPFEEPIALTFTAAAEERSMTRWLVAGQLSPWFDLRAPAEPSTETASTETESGAGVLAQYALFGFTHILPKGLDHVLFVLGLYLGARSFRSLLVLVTSFTLAHSITLGLASIGVIRLPADIVEPLIAVSIAWIAIENCFASPSRYRPLIVFVFGLLHGLGFASALQDLDLPDTHFLLALLSFNLGIEFGQLAVIVLALALTLPFRSRPWYRQRLVLPASFAIGAVAAAWTIQRVAQ